LKKRQITVNQTENGEIHLTFRQLGYEQGLEKSRLKEKEKAKKITKKQAHKPLLLRRV